MNNGTTTTTETYTDEEIDKAFEEAFGSDGIVFGEDDEGDGDSFDLNSWSPLQEVMDEMPKFDAGA